MVLRPKGFCTGVKRTFAVGFGIDRQDKPHPKPVKIPKVSVVFKFITDSGRKTIDINKTDNNPHYKGPDWILQPSFGRDFKISAVKNGKLHIVLIMEYSSSVFLVYYDIIKFEITPCA